MSIAVSTPSQNLSLRIQLGKRTVTNAMQAVELTGDLCSYFIITRPLASAIHTMLGASQFFTGCGIALFVTFKTQVNYAAVGLSFCAKKIADATPVSEKSNQKPLSSRVHRFAMAVHESIDAWRSQEPSEWRSSDIEPMIMIGAQNIIRGVLLDTIPIPFMGYALATYDMCSKYRVTDQENGFIKNSWYDAFFANDPTERIVTAEDFRI